MVLQTAYKYNRIAILVVKNKNKKNHCCRGHSATYWRSGILLLLYQSQRDHYPQNIL